jgi:uncharacterized protein YoaH (UPF0181 family)
MDETEREQGGASVDGPPDRAGPGPWVSRLIGRSLSDVRVHDTGQAGDLAGRLGARAFTAGRHVYVQPALVHPLTPQGVALLAHEMTHAVEQSGAAPVAPLPLLAPAGRPPAVQRVQGSTASGLSAGEARAVAVEAAALQAQQAPGARRAPAPPDPEDVAERVYRLLVQELLTDRERCARGWR